MRRAPAWVALVLSGFACATVNEELGARFTPLSVGAGERPVVYIYATGNTCALRLHAENGTFSLPIRTDGYFAFRPDPGPIEVAIQVPSRVRVFDYRVVAELEALPGGTHYLRCEVRKELSTQKMIVSVLNGARALPELEQRREIHPSMLEAW